MSMGQSSISKKKENDEVSKMENFIICFFLLTVVLKVNIESFTIEQRVKSNN